MSAAELFKNAADIFTDGSWGAGYGGKPWGECASTFYHYYNGDFSPKQFVDRVFALQHNGGSFLNKRTWKIGNASVESMKSIGDIHHNAMSDNDISALAMNRYQGNSNKANVTRDFTMLYGCACSGCIADYESTTGKIATKPGKAMPGNTLFTGVNSSYCSDGVQALWLAFLVARRTAAYEARRDVLEARRAPTTGMEHGHDVWPRGWLD